MRASIVMTLLVATLLAGCTNGSQRAMGPQGVDGCASEDCGDIQLEGGKGAITGLVYDDRLRPIPEASVLLLPLGIKAATNGNGEFGFVGLDPGIYTLRIDKERHEASPKRVDVIAGQFTDAIIEARRTAGEESLILTQEFAVFIPCALAYIVDGHVMGCGTDLSGENERFKFRSDYSSIKTATHLVTEVQMNQKSDWHIQVRADDNSSAGGSRYAVATIHDKDYLRVLNSIGVVNKDHNEHENNHPWRNEGPVATVVFFIGALQRELSGAGSSVGAILGMPNPVCCGVGIRLGSQATIVQSLFIGEPQTDLETYALLQ